MDEDDGSGIPLNALLATAGVPVTTAATVDGTALTLTISTLSGGESVRIDSGGSAIEIPASGFGLDSGNTQILAPTRVMSDGIVPGATGESPAGTSITSQQIPVVATVGPEIITLEPGASSVVISPTPGADALTLMPASSAATLSDGMVVSLASDPQSPGGPPVLLVGTGSDASTVTIPPASQTELEVSSQTLEGPDDMPILVRPSEPIIVAGNTLSAGAPAATVAGAPVSLASGSSIIVIGSSTMTLASRSSGGASASVASAPSSQSSIDIMISGGESSSISAAPSTPASDKAGRSEVTNSFIGIIVLTAITALMT